MPKKSKLNIRLLRKIKKHILAEPKRFAMEWWYGKAEPGHPPRLFHAESVAGECGTVACIAGWACLLSLKRMPKAGWIQSRAVKLLGIDDNELVYLCYWPKRFQHRYSDGDREEKAQAAADFIDYFIKTKRDKK